MYGFRAGSPSAEMVCRGAGMLAELLGKAR